MSFLLDTDTCSAYLKGDRRVQQRFLQYGGRLADRGSWTTKNTKYTKKGMAPDGFQRGSFRRPLGLRSARVSNPAEYAGIASGSLLEARDSFGAGSDAGFS